jgi:hypothetical protein
MNREILQTKSKYILIAVLAYSVLFHSFWLPSGFIQYQQIETLGEETLTLEDGSQMLKSDYLNLFSINLTLLVTTLLFSIISIILIIQKKLIGIYCYGITIALFIINDFIFANLSNILIVIIMLTLTLLYLLKDYLPKNKKIIKV